MYDMHKWILAFFEPQMFLNLIPKMLSVLEKIKTNLTIPASEVLHFCFIFFLCNFGKYCASYKHNRDCFMPSPFWCILKTTFAEEGLADNSIYRFRLLRTSSKKLFSKDGRRPVNLDVFSTQGRADCVDASSVCKQMHGKVLQCLSDDQGSEE